MFSFVTGTAPLALCLSMCHIRGVQNKQTMQLSKINPALAQNLGWDTESAQDEEMVTFVKRGVVFSEITLPKSEFIKMKNADEPSEYFSEEIEPKMETDEVMEDYGYVHSRYAVFEGDISSMTDDVIGMCDFEYQDCPDEFEIQKVKFAGFAR